MESGVDFLGGHFEAFEVTFPKLASSAGDDSSAGPQPTSLTLELFCANPRTHYEMCLRENTVSASVSAARQEGKATESQNAGSEKEDVIDHTGLRVYEGAQVMAAFIAASARDTFAPACELESESNSTTVKNKAACEKGEKQVPRESPLHVFGSLPSSVQNNSPLGESIPWVVELGCGCGLAGLTAAVFFPEMNIMLTDASVACLQLVQKSVERNRVSGVIPQHSSNRHIAYEPLMWTNDGAKELLRKMELIRTGSRARAPAASVRVILGSDIMYYRVDVNQLLATCRTLLVGQSVEESATSNDGDVANRWGVVIFAHYMRLPNGKKLLREAAHQLGFRIVRIPLSTFMDMNEVVFRGWNGIEVAVLAIRTDGSVCSEESEDVTVVRNVLRECFDLPASLPAACVRYTSEAEDAEQTRQRQQQQLRAHEHTNGESEEGIAFNLLFVDLSE